MRDVSSSPWQTSGGAQTAPAPTPTAERPAHDGTRSLTASLHGGKIAAERKRTIETMPCCGSRWLLLLAATMASTFGCAESDEAAAPGLSPRDLLRLDADLLPTRRNLSAATTPTPTVRARWPTDAGDPALTWWALRGPSKGPFRFTPVPAEAPLPLDLDGVGSTMALLDVAVGEVLQLSFTFTVSAEPHPATVLPVNWLELTTPIDTGKPLAGTKAQRLMEDFADRCVVVPFAEQRGSTMRFASWLTVAPTTRQLALFLPRPTTGLRLEQLLVERRSLTEWLQADVAEAHRPAHEKSVPDALGRVAVSLDREQRRTLRLSPDTQLSWTLPECERPYRFEAGLGLLPRDPILGGVVRITIAADGHSILEHTAQGSGSIDTPAWTPLAFDLPPGTRTLSLRAQWPSGDGPLAVLAHPRLRRAPLQPRQNLLIISLDTLRADRLGCYGGDAPSAHLDAFAATALRFETAYSTSAYTLPSQASLLSGQLPLLHGARRTSDRLDGERTPLLTTLLAEAGWVTAAFTGGAFVSTNYGFGTGFDRFSHNDPCWPVDTVRGRTLLEQNLGDESYEVGLLRRFDVGHIVDRLDGQPRGAPFFALVHTYATHDYAPNRRWLERAGLLGEDGQELRLDRRDYHAWKAGDLQLRQAVTDEFTKFYDASIGSADDFVGALLAGLDQARLSDDTIVVIHSDHGEELGELDIFGHGRSLNEGVTRVPLLVRIPGRTARVVKPTISLADLAPWLLELLGVDVDPAMGPAQALASDGGDPPARATTLLDLATGDADQWAVRSGAFKLWQRGDGEESRLYDLTTSAGERRDVSAQYPAVRARLERALQSYRDLQPARSTDTPNALDVETRRKLEQLGYLQGDG